MAQTLLQKALAPVVAVWLDVVNVWTKQQGFPQATLTDAATITWNGETQQNAKVTLGGNRTLDAMSNPVAGHYYTLVCVQDATGNRTLNLSNALYTFPGGTEPVLSTAANAVDILTFYYDGVKMRGVASKAFS
jgi:hypothetical protein